MWRRSNLTLRMAMVGALAIFLVLRTTIAQADEGGRDGFAPCMIGVNDFDYCSALYCSLPDYPILEETSEFLFGVKTIPAGLISPIDPDVVPYAQRWFVIDNVGLWIFSTHWECWPGNWARMPAPMLPIPGAPAVPIPGPPAPPAPPKVPALFGVSRRPDGAARSRVIMTL